MKNRGYDKASDFIKMSKEYITAHSGLALYAGFLRAIGVKEMVQLYMLFPGSNRGYGGWLMSGSG
jgi:hypothetical protein